MEIYKLSIFGMLLELGEAISDDVPATSNCEADFLPVTGAGHPGMSGVHNMRGRLAITATRIDYQIGAVFNQDIVKPIVISRQ